MTDQTFERRARTWLEAGPTDLPADAIANVMAAIDDVAQDRPPLSLFRSRSRARWVLLLAALLALAAGAAWVIGSQLQNSPPDPNDLLAAFPDATPLIERDGRTAAATEEIELGTVHGEGAFVLAGSCTGGDGMIAAVYYPSDIQAVPSGATGSAPAAIPDRAELATLLMNCDGRVHHRFVGTQELPEGIRPEAALTVSPGVTWRVAIGEYQALAAAPPFPAFAPTAGWYAVNDAIPNLVTSSMSFSVLVPASAATIGVQVRCFGDPVSVSAGTSAAARIPCDNPGSAIRLESPAQSDTLEVTVIPDGLTWVQLAAEADRATSAARPTAPPLPPDVAAAGFVESDGQYLAFGRVGSNEQATVYAPRAMPGVAGGDLVGVFVPKASDETDLELWSIETASRVRVLASIPGGDNYGQSWVDDTHGHVFYMVYRSDFTVEWRRVDLDGSDDQIVATAAESFVVSDGLLAIDHSVFVANMCPAEGPCTRVIHDLATDASRSVEVDGGVCSLIGAVAGTLVGYGGDACTGDVRSAIVAQELDGSGTRRLVDSFANARVVQSSSGPLLVALSGDEGGTTVSVLSLAGGPPRQVVTIEHDGYVEFGLTSVDLPVGDWFVVGGPLGDTFLNQFNARVQPRLLNIVTGELIDLPNLPGSP